MKVSGFIGAISFKVPRQKWMQTALDRMAEILDSCEWFPSPCQTTLPPYDSDNLKTDSSVN